MALYSGELDTDESLKWRAPGGSAQGAKPQAVSVDWWKRSLLGLFLLERPPHVAADFVVLPRPGVTVAVEHHA